MFKKLKLMNVVFDQNIVTPEGCSILQYIKKRKSIVEDSSGKAEGAN